MMLPIIPNAVGFGIETTAGRGGRLVVVDTLAPSGPGSLRAALELPEPRTVCFSVAGTIVLEENLRITHGNLRVAGQSAPGEGITIAGAGLELLDVEDVLLQHFRIRVGDRPNGPGYKSRDGLRLQSCSRVIVDHLSIAWALDENVDLWTGCQDITFRSCMVSECLVGLGPDGKPLHPDYPSGHSCGMRIGPGAQRVLLQHCVYAHNARRSALWTDGCTGMQIECVVYNPGSQAIGLGGAVGGKPIYLTAAGNWIIPGNGTNSQLCPVHVDPEVDERSWLFAQGNRFVGRPTPQQVGLLRGALVQFCAPDVAPVQCDGMRWLDAAEATSLDRLRRVVADAGAKPWAKDLTDTRVAGEVLARAGDRINSQNDREGLPIAAFPSSIPVAGGYSPLERYLNTLD
jgi:hypothetical protein